MTFDTKKRKLIGMYYMPKRKGDKMKEKSTKKVTKTTVDETVDAAVVEAEAAAPVVEEPAVKEEEKKTAKKETKSKTTKTSSKTTKTAAAKSSRSTAKTEKDAPKKTTAKSAVKEEEISVNVTLQFDGKAYTEKELTTIAKDVWKFDLQKEESDIRTIELYVKPEEGVCYYVFNSEITGSFRV